jgi:hypothetical protein|uniref:Amine oxidase domain-containing protein n=1 Tax=viral metagenome TaxID=1070528 RepID=A0A6C0ISU2_9ZZZZ
MNKNYDKIYIGTSLPLLAYIYFNRKENEKILIINKENYIGGSWFTKSNEYVNNLDTAGHFILFRNKDIGKKILHFFSNIGILMVNQNVDIRNKNYKFIENCIVLYPEQGWIQMFNIFLKKIDTYILLEHTVYSIETNNKSVTVRINNKKEQFEFTCNELVVPSYLKLNNIKFDNQVIELNYTLCKTYHCLFYCNTKNNNFDEKYHGFFDGSLFFDRFTTLKDKRFIKNNNKNINQVFILRVSRNFKNIIDDITNTEINKKLIEFFQKEKINIGFEVVDIEKINYEFFYRQDNIIECQNLMENIKNIKLLNTTDLGLIIENMFKEKFLL